MIYDNHVNLLETLVTHIDTPYARQAIKLCRKITLIHKIINYTYKCAINYTMPKIVKLGTKAKCFLARLFL